MERPFPAYRGDDPYTFVCYSHTDAELVYPELVWLNQQNCNIWYDEGIAPGEEWTEELAQAIKGASHFLYFVSPDSIQSRNCRDEVNFALENDQHLVSVYLKETQLTDGLRLSIGLTQAILKHELAEHIYHEKLLTALAIETQDATLGAPEDLSVRTTPSIQPPKTIRWRKPVGLGLVAVAIFAIGLLTYRLYEDATEGYSIAVLPFINLSNDERTGLLGRGLSDSIIDQLAQRHFFLTQGWKLKVAARTASFKLADQGEDLALIAEKLNVGYVLEGSVQRTGDNLLITAQLIRADDSFHIWSKTYERSLEDGFSIQAGVAQNTARNIEMEMLLDFWKRFSFFAAISMGTNSEAVEQYFTG